MPQPPEPALGQFWHESGELEEALEVANMDKSCFMLREPHFVHCALSLSLLAINRSNLFPQSLHSKSNIGIGANPFL